MTHRLTYVMAKIHHPCRMNGVAREGKLNVHDRVRCPCRRADERSEHRSDEVGQLANDAVVTSEAVVSDDVDHGGGDVGWGGM